MASFQIRFLGAKLLSELVSFIALQIKNGEKIQFFFFEQLYLRIFASKVVFLYQWNVYVLYCRLSFNVWICTFIWLPFFSICLPICSYGQFFLVTKWIWIVERGKKNMAIKGKRCNEYICWMCKWELIYVIIMNC